MSGGGTFGIEFGCNKTRIIYRNIVSIPYAFYFFTQSSIG
ncbi:hypothetical protein ADICYQ_0110 [Cyclobacterium qasimii M12-11B]|uniref:Uncharacterized protein n=1 Tax=Cyclobacterium qasimii M12-11B TaxID=641524 RepID=S7WXZ9_9BACT|nr:hypothetical protein ADICYQ_0110 [Cyclobacterium qasimii M12-11B]